MKDDRHLKLGATCVGAVGQPGVSFRLWAPDAREVDLLLTRAGQEIARPLFRHDGDIFETTDPDARAGDRYYFRRDAGPWWPDPASSSQPEGVHGASEIIDPRAFSWTDDTWHGPTADRQVLYEIHVGTYTPSADFGGVRDRLQYLADLGITVLELMPVAEFPGRWNWGYDGAALFAPSHRYGRPDDLRALVNDAHQLGLAVVLDVVYNHTGPDGCYLPAFAPRILRDDLEGPWGRVLDLRPGSGDGLRQFFIENAVTWIREYHLDGLRLDATHAIDDGIPPSFVADLTEQARQAAGDRRILVIAEDDRNLAAIVRSRTTGGWGLDGVWADDFHHQVHRQLTGESDGYYASYRGGASAIAETLRRGWFYTGQQTPRGDVRGTDPQGVPLERFVIALQNHDQIGNRAHGERLHHLADLNAVLAATALLLVAGETPLLFMGQEWACSSPFLFFTDHQEPLGTAVVEGRRREFASFSTFGVADGASLPSPQDVRTYRSSVLRWDELDEAPHRAVLAFTRQLLRFRHERLRHDGVPRITALDEDSIAVIHVEAEGTPSTCTFVRLSGGGQVTLDLSLFREGPAPTPAAGSAPRDPSVWVPMWSSRAVLSTDDGTLLRVTGERVSVTFAGPGAVMFGRRVQEICG